MATAPGWWRVSLIARSFSGACYRAANWIKVGKTQGRGRQDRFNKKALSLKAIYVYTANLFYRGHAHDTKDTKEFFVIRR
jgi:hypothetical protein